MAISEQMLKTALTQITGAILIQWPGVFRSQILTRGVHSKIFTRVIAV